MSWLVPHWCYIYTRRRVGVDELLSHWTSDESHWDKCSKVKGSHLKVLKNINTWHPCKLQSFPASIFSVGLWIFEKGQTQQLRTWGQYSYCLAVATGLRNRNRHPQQWGHQCSIAACIGGWRVIQTLLQFLLTIALLCSIEGMKKITNC